MYWLILNKIFVFIDSCCKFWLLGNILRFLVGLFSCKFCKFLVSDVDVVFIEFDMLLVENKFI